MTFTTSACEVFSFAASLPRRSMPPVAFLPPRLLLGSGSAIRRQLLEAAGISVTVSVPGIDEKGLGDRSDAEKLVHLLAEAKADVSSSRICRNYFSSTLLETDISHQGVGKGNSS